MLVFDPGVYLKSDQVTLLQPVLCEGKDFAFLSRIKCHYISAKLPAFNEHLQNTEMMYCKIICTFFVNRSEMLSIVSLCSELMFGHKLQAAKCLR